MARSVSILLAEPNALLREKLAGLLARREEVWCVVQVGVASGLVRAAAEVRPNLILADLQMLRDVGTVPALRSSAPAASVLALVETIDAPYRDEVSRLGLDGLMEKAHLVDEIPGFIDGLAGEGERTRG